MNNMEQAIQAFMHQPQQENQEILKCLCGNTWLYQVEVNQFTHHEVVTSQAPIRANPNNTYILICAKCGKPVNHNISRISKVSNFGRQREKIFREISEVIEDPKTPKALNESKKEHPNDKKENTQKKKKKNQNSGVQDSRQEDIFSERDK